MTFHKYSRGTALLHFWERALALLSFLIPLSVHASDLPPYYGTVELLPQTHPWTAAAYVDCDLLLRKLGVSDPLDPLSVRVQLDGTLLAARFEPTKSGVGRGIVSWSVPASDNDTEKRKFQIYFAPKRGEAWSSSDPELTGEPNLLPNGTFDLKSEEAQWPWKPVGPECVLEIDNVPGSHSGTHCLKLLPLHKTVEPGGFAWQCSLSTVPVRIESERKYNVSLWFRADDVVKSATPDIVSSLAVNWRDAEGHYIEHQNKVIDYAGLPNWTKFSFEVQAPPRAATAVIDLSFYGADGSFYIDDVVLVPSEPCAIVSARQTDGMGSEVQALMRDKGIFRFDFGPENSRIWPGFTGITPASAYDPSRGFGWLSADKSEAVERPLPDDLARDYVLANQSFAVDLPDGEYVVWMLIGDSGAAATVLPKLVKWKVLSDGQLLKTYAPDARTWYDSVMFRHFPEWWEPGVDVYDRFVAPRFEEDKFAITVKGGKTIFSFEKVPLCAMVIAPSEKAEELSSELDSLRAARKAAAPMSYSPPLPSAPGGLTKDDRERGYSVFSRTMGESVLPFSTPKAEERIEKMAAFAVPGQYQALTFGIYPLRDLGSVSICISNLRGPGHESIPASSVEIGVGRYVESTDNVISYAYQILPRVIQERNPIPMHGDMTLRWWMRVHVPDNIAAGFYSGQVTISPSQAPAYSLPIRIEVLPVKLASVPILAGLYHFDYVYWYTRYWNEAFGSDPWLTSRAKEYEKQNISLLQSYGINSLCLIGEDLRGDIRIENDKLSFREDGPFTQWMDLYAASGMKEIPWYAFGSIGDINLPGGIYGKKVPVLSTEWSQYFREIVTWIKNQEKERGWPEIVLNSSDELSNIGPAAVDAGVRILRAFNEIRGNRPWRTVASVNGPLERKLLPHISIIMPNSAYPITVDSIKEIHANNVDLWIYNIGNSRATWGFYPWRVGAKARYQWFNCQVRGDPWSAFDGDTGYMTTQITPGKPLGSPDLIEIGEGLNDLRYITTLENWIEKAKAQSLNQNAIEAAIAAQKDLDSIKEAIPVDPRAFLGEISAQAAGVPAKGDLANHTRLDEWRLKIASHIMNIEKNLPPQ